MGFGRWKLLRALGAVAADPAAAGELGLPSAGTTGHDEVFAVNCPPVASLYLGDDQGRLAALASAALASAALGSAALTSAAAPSGPPEPDHLTVLLDWYAGLGEAGEDGARRTLFGEFLWPWLPAYLGAVRDLPPGPLTGWAELTLDALRDEREQDRDPGEPLPWALREAPPPVRLDGLIEGLIEGLLTPLRSGMILTRRAVAAGAQQVGAGQRIGNRRRALAAMLAAEPERTAHWLAGQADHWAHRHGASRPGTSRPGTSPHGAGGPDPVQLWWADRAAGTARLFRGAGVHAAGGGRETECV